MVNLIQVLKWLLIIIAVMFILKDIKHCYMLNDLISQQENKIYDLTFLNKENENNINNDNNLKEFFIKTKSQIIYMSKRRRFNLYIELMLKVSLITLCAYYL